MRTASYSVSLTMPNNNKSTADLAANAVVTAGLLSIGHPIALASGAVLLATICLWILGHSVQPIAFFGSVISALLQGYFALRVHFDATIFSLWAVRWKDSYDPCDDLKAFDVSIRRQSAESTSAQISLDERRQGALRLMRYQVITVLLQLVLAAIALWQ